MSTNITEIDATDLIGRLVTNTNGAEFIVTRLSFDAQQACVIIWLDELDENARTMGREAGLYKLDGWTIHQPLSPRRG